MSNTALRAGEISVDGVRSPLLEGGRAESDEAVVFVHGNPALPEGRVQEAIVGIVRDGAGRNPADGLFELATAYERARQPDSALACTSGPYPGWSQVPSCCLIPSTRTRSRPRCGVSASCTRRAATTPGS